MEEETYSAVIKQMNNLTTIKIILKIRKLKKILHFLLKKT